MAALLACMCIGVMLAVCCISAHPQYSCQSKSGLHHSRDRIHLPSWGHHSPNHLPERFAPQQRHEITVLALEGQLSVVTASCVLSCVCCFRRIDGKDAAGSTPLIDACGGMRGHRHAARLLLDAGADVNARSRSGRTPLLAAVMHANMDLIEYLLRCEV